MTHRNGHQDGDRFSRKQHLVGNHSRNENDRQHFQYETQQRYYAQRHYPERPVTSGQNEEFARNFGPSYAASDYYGRNLDSERGLYAGDPNYSSHDYSAPRYFQSREQEPRFLHSDNYAPMQHYRGSNEDWSGYGYGDLGAQRPGFEPGHDAPAASQGDYFGQAYSAEKGGHDKGYRGKGPKGYMRSDDRLKEDISERLTDDYFIDASDIEVISKDGVVTVSGTVGNRQLKHRVEDIIERCHGVKDIDNRLKIKNPVASEQRLGAASQSGPGSQGNKKQ